MYDEENYKIPSNFYDELKIVSSETIKTIDKLLPLIEGPENRLIDAMRYASISEGKCFRPFLLFCCAKIFSIPFSKINEIAAAIEMIHCYSLVHDDLPSMDDDSMRRGKPSCHVAYDEATSILTGDALLTNAFFIISNSKIIDDDKVKVSIISKLSEAIGSSGMVGGQMLDILSIKRNFHKDELLRIKELKTARLISVSCEIGGVIGGANNEELLTLSNFGKKIGIAYQVIDDLFDNDIISISNKSSSKFPNSLVTLSGAEESRNYAKDLVQKAIISLNTFGPNADLLKNAAMFVLHREN